MEKLKDLTYEQLLEQNRQMQMSILRKDMEIDRLKNRNQDLRDFQSKVRRLIIGLENS